VTPPPPNSYGSPGSGCAGGTLYDGSAEANDLQGGSNGAGFTVSSNASGQVIATFTVDGTIPGAGTTAFPGGMDLPASNFVGGNYYALCQNKTIQTNVAYTACPQIPPRPTPILQRFGSWKDGHHFLVGFAVNWDGTKWIYSARIGEYFPGPDGGFSYFELGVNDGVDDDGDTNLWDFSNVYHPFNTTAAADNWSVDISGTGPTTITVKAPGVYKEPDTTNCNNGHFDYWFGKTGDVIANSKALTTGNATVTLPTTVPLSELCGLSGGALCENDITSVGGFVFFTDTTSGTSTAGALNSNITGIAYSGGAIGVSDTLGEGPTCPTPTVGGAIQDNPLFTPDTACHIDDDNVSRGSFLSEWWETIYSFTF
jgi:hypothetical protein